MKIMRRFLQRLLLLTLPLALPVQAEVTVLVHGLLGSSNSWEQSGAVNALQQMGWERAGRVEPGGPSGTLISRPTQPPRGNRQLYLVDIPSLIPLEEQAELLEQTLTVLSNHHPEESIYLVGHSAGGVVARITTVRDQIPNLKALITIATPHLGSPYANLAYDIATLPYPFRLLPKMVANKKYKALRRARPMIKGLTVAKPGTLLYGLNQQPHPEIRYISIVRQPPVTKKDEKLVPLWSQDMNRVAALAGRSTTIPTRALHFISAADGYLLGQLLNQMVTEEP